MSDIDPKELAEALIGENGRIGAVAKYCARNQQCSRQMTCEYAHSDKRGGSVSVEDLFQGKSPDLGDCSNFRPRQELCSTGDLPRRKPGQRVHNAHAPDRTRVREALGFKGLPDLTKGQGSLTEGFSPNNFKPTRKDN